MRRIVLGRIVLALGACMLALLVGEAVARIAAPGLAPRVGERALYWVHHQQLGWAHRPSVADRFRGPHWDVQVQINSQGLRDIEHALAKPPGVRRVLMLGDSMGWGFGVEQELAAASVVRARCPAWDVVNASVSGYSTDQEYLYWKDAGRSYHPDVVLVLFHPNDLTGNSLHRMYGYEKPRFELRAGELVLGNVPVPGRRLWERAHAWLIGNTWLGNGILRRPALSRILEYGLPPGASDVPIDLEVTRALFARLAVEARADGSELIVAPVPMPQPAAAFLGEVARKAAIRVIDLATPLAARQRAGVAITLPNDEHWNEEGHRIVGETIARALGCGAAAPGRSGG